jgi:hypothetical protein
MGAVVQCWCRSGTVSTANPTAPATRSTQGPAATITRGVKSAPSGVFTPCTAPRPIWIAVTGRPVSKTTPRRRAARAIVMASVYGSTYPSPGIHAAALTPAVSRKGTRALADLGVSSSTSRPHDRALATCSSSSRTRPSVSASLRLPTCRNPLSSPCSAVQCSRRSTTWRMDRTISSLERSWPTSPAACGVFPHASSRRSRTTTSRKPARAR